jgi:hypothetical protein
LGGPQRSICIINIDTLYSDSTNEATILVASGDSAALQMTSDQTATAGIMKTRTQLSKRDINNITTQEDVSAPLHEGAPKNKKSSPLHTLK